MRFFVVVERANSDQFWTAAWIEAEDAYAAVQEASTRSMGYVEAGDTVYAVPADLVTQFETGTTVEITEVRAVA